MVSSSCLYAYIRGAHFLNRGAIRRLGNEPPQDTLRGRGVLLLVTGAAGRAAGAGLGLGRLGITGATGAAASGSNLVLGLFTPAKQIFQSHK